jgi:4-hydroxy-tetrahydrodipicolinate synthase
MARFGEVLTAMVTPFNDDLSVDVDGAVELARWLADHGNDRQVVAGTTGESPTLTDEEQIDLGRAVAEAVTIPVVLGTGSNDTRHGIELTKRAKATGAAGVLLVTPYYNRPSQAGIDAHFRAMAEATDLPVMLYDIAFRTGRAIATDTLLTLAREVKNIVAVKDASGDIPQAAQRVAQAPSGFELYSGEDVVNLPLLAIGAVGIVGVATHWAGQEAKDMVTAFKKGDVEEARRINQRLLESWAFESGDPNPNPIPTKAMLRTMGLPAGHTRPPMGPCPDGLEDRARQVLKNLRG